MTAGPYLLEVAAISSVGLVRTLNEDCVSVGRQILPQERLWSATFHGDPLLLLVADGMGGHARGEVASQLAIEFLNMHSERMADAGGAIEALRDANRHVFEAGRESPDQAGMGATLVGAQIAGSRLIWFNVGDSRAYRWRGGRLSQLSIDHVPVRGTGGPRASHAITQSLGGTFRSQDVWPAVGTDDWLRGDWLLLCSDGLTDTVPDEGLASLLASSKNAEEAALALLGGAIEQGAPDNVSVLVVAAR